MKNIIKSATWVGALSMALFSTGFAAENETLTENRNEGDRRFEYRSAKQKKQHMGEITPPAGPRATEGWDMFVTGSFIYYQAVQDGLEFAYDGVLNNIAAYIPAAEPFVSIPQGQIASVGNDWIPGFKAGLGFNTNHDNWSLYAEYTYLRGSNTATLRQTPTEATNFHGMVNSSITTYYGSSAATTTAYSCDAISADWRLNHNKVNLELARNFYVSQFLTIKPFAGLAGVWQKQTVKTSALQNVFVVGDDTILNPTFRDSQVMEAYSVGARGGFNLGWYFTKAFSLQTSMAGNALWTNYNSLTLTSTMYNPDTLLTSTFVNQSNPNYYNVNYVAELELALSYELYFNDNNNCFSCQVGWDGQTWINWGHFLYESSIGSHDFSMQGLNVKVRFDF